MEKKDHSSRLTTGQMMALNHGQINIPASLRTIIDSYAMPACCLTKQYGNPYNPYFKNGRSDAVKIINASRTMNVRKATASHTDDHIFQDLRKVFASIVKGKDGTVLPVLNINRMLIPSSKSSEIGELFFQTMIQCPLQIDEYLKVLFSLKRSDDIEHAIRLAFAKKTMATFNSPVKLSDTKISDGETLTRQHREATCMVVTKLYAYDYKADLTVDLSKPNNVFSSYERLKEKYLNVLIGEISEGKGDAIKILATSLKVLSGCKKYPTLIKDYQEQLNIIYNNLQFKLTVRLAVKDFIIAV